MNKLKLYVATLGVGKWLPIFGTIGSLISVPVCLLAIHSRPSFINDILWYFYNVVTVFFLGIWSIPEAERQLGPMTDPHGKIRDRDQNQIGVDETLGMLITTIPIFLSVRDHTPHWLILAFWYISAFFIFRFFDMVKLWPASYFDKKIKNEWGVMLDDAFAGVYSAIVLLGWMHFSHGFMIAF